MVSMSARDYGGCGSGRGEARSVMPGEFPPPDPGERDRYEPEPYPVEAASYMRLRRVLVAVGGVVMVVFAVGLGLVVLRDNSGSYRPPGAVGTGPPEVVSPTEPPTTTASNDTLTGPPTVVSSTPITVVAGGSSTTGTSTRPTTGTKTADLAAPPATTATTTGVGVGVPTAQRVAPSGIVTDCFAFDPAVGSAPAALLAQVTDDLASSGLACNGDASGPQMTFSFATPAAFTQVGLRPAFIPAGSPESDTGKMRRITSARWDCGTFDGRWLASVSQTFADGTLQVVPASGAFNGCSVVALTILGTAPGEGFDVTPVTEVWFGT